MDDSPRWTPTTKFIVMLAGLAVIGFFLIRFQGLVAPLILVVLTVYLLNPAVTSAMKLLRLPRSIAVLAVFAVLILLLAALVSGAGMLIQQQFSGVLSILITFINSIPDWIKTLAAQPVSIGPFTFDLTAVDNNLIQNALLPSARDGITRITGWMTGAASGVASFVGWAGFVFIVSFYLLLDLDAVQKNLVRAIPEEYRKDAGRLAAELGPIWNAFLRGQLILALVTGLAVGVTMGLFGVRYALILGLIAALMDFVPILGYYVTIGSQILVAVFQPSNPFGFSPALFIGGVAVAAWGLQQLKISFLIPRVMQSQLKVHPAVLIVGAFVGASLLGLTGLLLSAPIIATAALFGKYVHAKLFNLPPWPGPEEIAPPEAASADAVQPARLPRQPRRKPAQRRPQSRSRRVPAARSAPPVGRQAGRLTESDG